MAKMNTIYYTKYPVVPLQPICNKCETQMVEGIAIGQTYVGGMPDFEDEGYSSTFYAGGTGKVIDCWKCPDCGRSITKDMSE